MYFQWRSEQIQSRKRISKFYDFGKIETEIVGRAELPIFLVNEVFFSEESFKTKKTRKIILKQQNCLKIFSKAILWKIKSGILFYFV